MRHYLIDPIRRFKYEILAFVTGASVLMLEIVGARLISPYFGSSTYVWTAMIGVILGALALGYWYGGRLADRSRSEALNTALAILMVIGGVLVILVALIQVPVLEIISDRGFDLRVGAFIAAVLLFAPASAFVGMVSPHLAKIRITSLKTSGQSVGRLEAAGTIGSITGTFLTGYVLLGFIGSQALCVGIGVGLIVASFIAEPRIWRIARLVLIVVGIFISSYTPLSPGLLADIDTPYARFRVDTAQFDGKDAVVLRSDASGVQSAIDPNDPTRLLFAYNNRFMDALNALQLRRDARILVIGGGTFTFPAAVAAVRPDIRIDAVEIDPDLPAIARTYFAYSDPPSVAITIADARTFVSDADDAHYDAVFVDAYNNLTPPFQLATREFVAEARRTLKPGGALIANVVARYHDGVGRTLFTSMAATYRSEMGYLGYYFSDPLHNQLSSAKTNIIFIASNDASTFGRLKNTFDSITMPAPDKSGGVAVLTDDYAPVEQLAY